MRRPVQHKGYVRSGRIECDVMGCSHCSASIVIPPNQTTRLDRCGACDRTICARCAEEMARSLKCVTWEARLERLESRGRMLRAITEE